MINAIQEFKKLVAPEKTRVESLFPLIFVFGGPALDSTNKYSSCRNVFLNWAHDTSYRFASDLRIPEEYPEWNDFEGYSNLVDFEKDAGCLSRGILLFSESHGTSAELGTFCTDEVLCERLLVVVARDHYQERSYIRLGPVKRIEVKHSAESVYVATSIDNKEVFEAEVAEVGGALSSKVESLPKSKQFRSNETRDQFLLIADLIELFGALTEKELEILLGFMGVTPENLKRMLNQLVLFELVSKRRGKTNWYYLPHKQRTHYLNYSAIAGEKFERAPFKLSITIPELKKDKDRSLVHAEIHGVPR